MSNQGLNNRLNAIREKAKPGYMHVVDDGTVLDLLSDIRFLLGEIERNDLINIENKNPSGCYISALRAEIEGYCTKHHLSLSSDEYDAIAQDLANNTELNDTLIDVITSAVDEHLLGRPGTMQAAFVTSMKDGNEEVSSKGFDRFYPCGTGFLFTLHMDELCEDEIKELATLCDEHFVVGFRGNPVILWRY